jgi:hypothetical protein
MTKAKADSETGTVHFLEDGITGRGRVYYRDEELTLEVGSDDYELTIDQSTGRSWLDMTEEEQVERYGRPPHVPPRTLAREEAGGRGWTTTFTG